VTLAYLAQREIINLDRYTSTSLKTIEAEEGEFIWKASSAFLALTAAVGGYICIEKAVDFCRKQYAINLAFAERHADRRAYVELWRQFAAFAGS
jgi:hypothetical protein